MGITSWLKSAFSKEETFRTQMSVSTEDKLTIEVFYKELAIQSCISFIANALVMSEFQTFENGQEVKKMNHYLLNVEPNLNQNATEFWHEVIWRLIYDNECLIIQQDDQFFVAEDFSHTEFAFKEDIYSNVVVRGFSLSRSFVESEVFYLKLNNKHIKKLIDGLYSDYGELLARAKSNYKKSGGRKGVFYQGGYGPVSGDDYEKQQEMLQQNFKRYFESENAVLNLSDGDKYVESQFMSVGKDSRDIRNLVNDVIDFACAAFHIPSGVVRGDTVGVAEQTDNTIMFGINPFAKLITTEMNRKWYGMTNYLNNSFVRMDTKKIRDVDIEKMSNSADLLFRIGVHSVNDNREMFGKSLIDEPWANEHYVTKNYNSILDNEFNESLKGGDEDGEHGTKNDESRNS